MNALTVIKKAIEHYGQLQQMDMAIEEMSELTKAICKYKRAVANKDKAAQLVAANQIAEECADVQIMMEQVRQMANPVKVDKVFVAKIDRLNDRIERERERGICPDK